MIFSSGSGSNVLQGGMGKDVYIIGNGNNALTDFDDGYLGYYNASGQLEIITDTTEKIAEGAYAKLLKCA